MQPPVDAPSLRPKPSARQLAAVALVAGAVTFAGSAPAAAKTRWFHSPSGNIQCEVSADDARGTRAYCQSFKRAQSVTLRGNGSMRMCRGTKCLGNGPENASTLGYGQSVRLGPFRCTSLRRGMRCTAAKSGKGFLISSTGIRRF